MIYCFDFDDTLTEDEKNGNLKFFEENKYVKIPQVLKGLIKPLLYGYVGASAQRCKLIQSEYPDLYRNFHYGAFCDPQVEGPHSKYGDLIFDVLGLILQKYVENITGLNLVFTYSYFRLYTKGTELPLHGDRESCEISISLCLGYSGDQWPLYMNGTPVYMEPGDMVIYRGEDIPHWRKSLEGEYHAQAFLHYNDINGPYGEENLYDKRPSIGMPYDKTKYYGES